MAVCRASLLLFLATSAIVLTASTTPTCEEIDCNWGYCVVSRDDRGRRHRCVCQEGYVGERCERIAASLKKRTTRDVGLCDNEPCMNGGTCTENLSSEEEGDEMLGEASGETPYYHCVCAPEFTGLNCSGSVQKCLVSNCSNCSSDESACSQCTVGYHLQEGLCKRECEVEDCLKCTTNGSFCLQCLDEYQLVAEDECVKEKALLCSVLNCLECDTDMPLMCRKCQDGYRLIQNNSRCERECFVRNCSNCITNFSVCDACINGYTLSNNTCRKTSNTECNIDGCRVCRLNADVCEVCEKAGAEFESSSKRCTIKTKASNDENSALDLNFIVIIGGGSFVALIALMTVLILCCLLSWYCRKKKRNKTLTLYPPRRSASAELFDRIHSSFSLPLESIRTSTTEANTETDPFETREAHDDGGQEEEINNS